MDGMRGETKLENALVTVVDRAESLAAEILRQWNSIAQRTLSSGKSGGTRPKRERIADIAKIIHSTGGSGSVLLLQGKCSNINQVSSTQGVQSARQKLLRIL